jgi:ABC-2 type transport system ATP-binding protein
MTIRRDKATDPDAVDRAVPPPPPPVPAARSDGDRGIDDQPPPPPPPGAAVRLDGDGEADDRIEPGEPAPSEGRAVPIAGAPDEREEREELDDFDEDEEALAPDGAITFAGVGKQFGGVWVVRGLDLDVGEGSIVGLIGPSGCGKTTAIRLITGVYRPDEGEVRLLGREPHEIGRRERVSVGYLPQEPVLFDELSLRENLSFHASLSGVRFWRRRWLRQLLQLVELRGHERKLVREASGGMKRRLALAAALVHKPPILLLDEPTAGLDPVLRVHLWEHFRALRDEGRTLVIATQYVGEAADCDQVVLLNEGRVAAVGPPEMLRRSAFEADRLEIETVEPVARATVERLAALDPIRSVSLLDVRRLRLAVDDGGVALPLVFAVLRDDGHEIVDSEEIVPGYDEVFIELVERDSELPGAAVDGGSGRTATRERSR